MQYAPDTATPEPVPEARSLRGRSAAFVAERIRERILSGQLPPGNCLSALSMARIGGAVGVGIAKRMVLLGEIITAQEMLDRGFLLKIVEQGAMDAEIAALTARAAENAPLTTRASKETIRLMALGTLPDIEAIVAEVYGSADFRRGVETFLAKTKAVPNWTGS